VNDRPHRAATTAAVLVTAVTITACATSSPSARTRTDPTAAQAEQETLTYARCMRAHGVAHFPDDLDYRDVAGIDPASPAFASAQTACRHLLPVKTPPAAAPSSRTEAKLLALSACLRTHGYPDMPDPRPNPPPQGGSAQADRYSALFGEGDYWIGIPKDVDAHGAAFIHALHECHANP